MQNINHKYTSTIWFLAGIIFVVLLSNASNAQDEREIENIIVNMDYNNGMYFLDEDDVEFMITSQLPEEEMPVKFKDIDLQLIENYVEANPYIDYAELFVDINGNIKVSANQKKPILRIVTADNNSYYLSQDAEKIPISQYFTARVPVASGAIYDNKLTEGQAVTTIVKDLHYLSDFISKNEFLKALVEQIYVTEEQEFVLIPKLGNHEIIIGQVDNSLQEKCDKLLTFYQQGLNTRGWNVYKSLNLKYKNQVVCTK